jgi:hypothetical protein
MTRFRDYVNPEWRDTPLVHAQEKKHSNSTLSAPRGAVTFQIWAAVLIRSAYADNEKEENRSVC